MAKGMSGEEAYYAIPFEREAYDHQETEGYLESRRFYAWIDHI